MPTPYQRLIHLGPHTLTDQELTRIAFGKTGVAHMQALQAEFSGPPPVWGRRQRPSGVCPHAFRRAEAWCHLNTRWQQRALQTRPLVDNTARVAAYLGQTMAHRNIELFNVLMLDSKMRLIDTYELSRGSINQARVYPREIIRTVLDCCASAVVLAHNHPSGDPQPSASDQALTERLESLLNGIEVDMVDHFIVTPQTIKSIKFGTITPTGLSFALSIGMFSRHFSVGRQMPTGLAALT